MRFRVSAVLSLMLAGASGMYAAAVSFHVAADAAASWGVILGSIGCVPATGGPANVFVVKSNDAKAAPQWIERIEQGAFVILEGDSELAHALGFRPAEKHVVIQSIVDERAPKLSIVWEKALESRTYAMPAGAVTFAYERWEHVPVMAGLRKGKGAVLWIIASPGQQGYERFPYLLQAMCDLGLKTPLRSARLWAFFDSAYRSRVDIDYFAERWRKAGIAALQVAAWHYFEPDKEGDEYLRNLIDACHRNGILVYAWLELPHVSEHFWADHPAWREKTAVLQDAQLDWRKLMNLENPEAYHAAEQGTRALLERFDWDGVNLAELYFESLEGASNASRFTPMNDDVRAEFRKQRGFDPLELFKDGQAAPGLRLQMFLDFRAELARKWQSKWMGVVESVREKHPDLDVVLTHVDDRFDTRMRSLIGADSGMVLPMLKDHDFTFLIEDPATIWNLGPQRYPQIAARYQPLTPRPDKMAIDVNIVDRYQDVYPTKQQTGTELMELVHTAAQSFPRVALYFEKSILPPDISLLSAAAATVDKFEENGGTVKVTSKYGTGVPWHGPAMVNGRLWPVHDEGTLWLPSGSHTATAAAKDAPVRVLDFNGELRSASSRASGIELAYEASSRAIAIVSAKPKKVTIDELASTPHWSVSGQNYAVMLPRGQHLVSIETTP